MDEEEDVGGETLHVRLELSGVPKLKLATVLEYEHPFEVGFL